MCGLDNMNLQLISNIRILVFRMTTTMKYLLYILFFLIGFSSCTTPNEEAFEFDLSTVYNQINFEKSSVGQVSTYIHFDGSDFGLASSAINYTGDTLLVSLIAKSGNNFTFQERITIGSSVYDVSNPYIEGHDMLKTSEWQVVMDTLRLTGGSTFLYWPGRELLPFVLPTEATNNTLRTWGTNTNSFSEPFNIRNGRVNDFNYEDIIGVYDVIDTPVDGDGYEILYNRPFGVIRSSRFGAENLNGFGWDLQLGN